MKDGRMEGWMSGATLLEGHSDKIFAVAWSPDGRYLASGSRDKTVRIWNVATGICEYIYRGHAQCLLAVAWSPDSNDIASGDTSGIVHVWDALTGTEIVSYSGHARFAR